jgi:hypothetical protein
MPPKLLEKYIKPLFQAMRFGEKTLPKAFIFHVSNVSLYRNNCRTTFYPGGTMETKINNAAAKKTSPVLTDFLEHIRKRAYQIYLESGKAPGNDMKNWLQAEKEIKQRYKLP